MKKGYHFLYFLFVLFFISSKVFATDATVLTFSTNVKTDGKKLWKSYHVVLQINSPNANKFCEFRIPYSKKVKLKELKASITDLNGNEIRKLSKREITTSSYFSNIAFYSDNLIKRFNLIHNQYPYLIDLTFTYKSSSFIDLIHWNPIWDDEIPTVNANLSFTFPAGYQFHQKLNNIEPARKQTIEDTQTYTWQAKYDYYKKENIFMPPLSESEASVEITPFNFKYIEAGTLDSWQHYGDWQVEISKGLENLPAQEKITIDELTKDATNTTEIIKILYHYLQDNTRYTLVQIDFGGMQPYPAEYVCKNRYGDCKALTNYLKAMLKYKDIEAYPVDVSAGDNKEFIDPDYPSQQFNHVFLCVPVNRDTIWLECTSNTAPFNYLGTFIQNRKGLLVAASKSKLVNIPAMKKSNCQSIFKYQFEFTEKEKSMVTSRFRFKGNYFEMLNSFNKQATDKEKEDYIDQFFPAKNISLNNWEIISTHRDSAFIDLSANYIVTNPFSSIANYTKVDHPLMVFPEFEKIKERYYPVRLNYPISFADTIQYINNFAGLAYNDQDTITIDSKFGKFTMVHLLSEKMLTVVRTLDMPAQEVPLSEYPEFYAFYQKFSSTGKSTFLKK